SANAKSRNSPTDGAMSQAGGCPDRTAPTCGMSVIANCNMPAMLSDDKSTTRPSICFAFRSAMSDVRSQVLHRVTMSKLHELVLQTLLACAWFVDVLPL